MRQQRIVLYTDDKQGVRFGNIVTLKVARVVEFVYHNRTYVLQSFDPLHTDYFVICATQVSEDGYITSWPPLDADREQAAENIAKRLEVLGKEQMLLAEKLRRIIQ